MTTSFPSNLAYRRSSWRVAKPSAASAGHLSEHVTVSDLIWRVQVSVLGERARWNAIAVSILPFYPPASTDASSDSPDCHLRCRQSTCFGPPTLSDALDHQQRNALFLSTFTSVCVIWYLSGKNLSCAGRRPLRHAPQHLIPTDASFLHPRHASAM
ncbi:hypothetical protein C8R45DRAFT_1218123 [Mycena sanguinolenta]|nr:hypothetical protein C8R45DRAFT_1218123 [Mycena sanguinolenta]